MNGVKMNLIEHYLKKVFLAGFIIFLCSISNIFGQSLFDDCLELERIKAKEEGIGYESAINLATKICLERRNKKSARTFNTSSSNGFISVNLFPIATLTNSNSFNSRLSATADIIAQSNTGNGYNFKLGYKFSNVRVYYSPSSFSSGSATYSIEGLGIDYLAGNGFFMGLGFGSGSVVESTPTCENCDGTANIFNIGYLSNSDSQFHWGVNISSSSFSYEARRRNDTEATIVSRVVALGLELEALF
jgi:hypothetical protein